MTTLEITISDNSKVSLLLSLLKELSFVDVKNIKESADNQLGEPIDERFFDKETQRRVSDSISRNLIGDKSHLVEISNIDLEKKVFHEL